MHELLTAYPVTVTIPVAWGEMDAYQHVNNVTYFRYFESARIRYLERLQIDGFLTDGDVRPILHSINCRFRLPLTYPDTVFVGVRVTTMGDDRMTMEHCVISEQHRQIAAQGTGIVVTFDYAKGIKAPIPEPVRAAILALEATVDNEVAPFTRG